MTKKEILEAAMKAKFNTALREAAISKKNAANAEEMVESDGYERGLKDGLEVALYVIREKG